MIKILSGIYKGRKLLPIKDLRPTESKIREAVFNILYPFFQANNIVFADICCGTGALGFEALSRNAEKVILMDNRVEIINKAHLNAKNFNIPPEKIKIIYNDLQKQPLNIKNFQDTNVFFIDPPYNRQLAMIILRKINKLLEQISHQTMIIVETDDRNHLDDCTFDNLIFIDKKKYGHILLYIFQNKIEQNIME